MFDVSWIKDKHSSEYLFALTLILYVLLGSTSCNSEIKEQRSHIAELEVEVEEGFEKGEEMKLGFREKVIELADAKTRYARTWPEDTLSVYYLEDAADRNVQGGRYALAVAQLDELAKSYPDHPLAVDALYKTAIICENNKEDFVEAKTRYQKFAETYPDDARTKEINLIVQHLGDPEALLDAVLKKAGESEN